MAISAGTSTGRNDRRTPSGSLDSLSRYDLTLLVIPLVFLCALGLGSVLPVPMLASLLLASLCGAAVVTDALFLNPPTAR